MNASGTGWAVDGCDVFGVAWLMEVRGWHGWCGLGDGRGVGNDIS